MYNNWGCLGLGKKKTPHSESQWQNVWNRYIKKKNLVLANSAYLKGISLSIPTHQRNIFQEAGFCFINPNMRLYLKFSKSIWFLAKQHGNRINSGQTDLALNCISGAYHSLPIWKPLSPDLEKVDGHTSFPEGVGVSVIKRGAQEMHSKRYVSFYTELCVLLDTGLKKKKKSSFNLQNVPVRQGTGNLNKVPHLWRRLGWVSKQSRALGPYSPDDSQLRQNPHHRPQAPHSGSWRATTHSKDEAQNKQTQRMTWKWLGYL